MLVNPLVEAWWKSGVSPYSAEFREEIETARAGRGDAVWKYIPMAEL